MSSDRIDVLAHRVRWLDRHRRAIAILVALFAFGMLAHQLSEELGETWLGVVTTIISILCAALTWWLVEVGLAWLTALWETEHHRLTRDRGLPRAELIRRRK
jgi:hypothetical protein